MYMHYSEGVVNKPEVAVKLAEVLITRFYGEEEVTAQKPLQATVKDDRWIIEGSQKKDRLQPTSGPVTLILSKIDAQVLGVHKGIYVPVDPSVATSREDESPRE